jgi:hypothetical protein
VKPQRGACARKRSFYENALKSKTQFLELELEFFQLVYQYYKG